MIFQSLGEQVYGYAKQGELEVPTFAPVFEELDAMNEEQNELRSDLKEWKERRLDDQKPASPPKSEMAEPVQPAAREEAATAALRRLRCKPGGPETEDREGLRTPRRRPARCMTTRMTRVSKPTAPPSASADVKKGVAPRSGASSAPVDAGLDAGRVPSRVDRYVELEETVGDLCGTTAGLATIDATLVDLDGQLSVGDACRRVAAVRRIDELDHEHGIDALLAAAGGERESDPSHGPPQRILQHPIRGPRGARKT